MEREIARSHEDLVVVRVSLACQSKKALGLSQSTSIHKSWHIQKTQVLGFNNKYSDMEKGSKRPYRYLTEPKSLTYAKNAAQISPLKCCLAGTCRLAVSRCTSTLEILI